MSIKRPTAPYLAASRRHFTLLEILIVLALIGLVSGVAAVSINKMFTHQRFRNEVELVLEHLRLAQDLMLILDSDLHLVFAEDRSGGKNTIILESETKLPPEVQKEIARKPGSLTLIKGIFFKDQLGKEPVKGKIDIAFLSNGAVMSKGVMRLSSSDSENPPSNALQSYICLPGYVRPIFSYESKAAAEKACDQFENREFDLQLTQDTFSRLPEKIRSPADAEQHAEQQKDFKQEVKKDSKANEKNPKK
jgi:prepilin-type N-terminal cleavage/methylation domain-containing protein